jgi:hypothetical protein
MSLGFDAISALPFATSGPDSDVNVSVTGNQVTISIGSAGVIADSVTENLTPSQVTLGLGTLSIRTDVDVLPSGVDLTLATGNVTITADANISPTGSGLTLDTVEPGVITWNDIVPGATMVWTPIKPY